MVAEIPRVSLDFERVDGSEMRRRAESLLERARRRRSVRMFSDEKVDIEAVEHCIEVAASAPSGANKQPWTFVLVTKPEVRREIRLACEREEAAFYSGRASQRWLDDVRPLGTVPEKPYLETVPALIVVFAQRHGERTGDRHYYVTESVGIAVGFLIAALHEVGLATLPHTPAPMKFLSDILRRPSYETPYVLLPVGYPAPDCTVPAISRKPLSEVLVRV